MLLTIAFTTFILLFLVMNMMLSEVNARNAKIDRRMSDIAHTVHVPKEEDNKTLHEKIIDGISTSIEKGFYKGSKEYRSDRLQKNLDAAGLSKTTTPIRYMAHHIFITFVLMCVSCVLFFLISKSAGTTLLFALLTTGFYAYLQRFLLIRKIAQRRHQMIRDLPYTLDLILVSIEAGLSFDGALGKVVATIPGSISDEFAKTLKEIRMGIERKTALKNMSTRCGIKELSTLITSIIQADELGVSLSKILRIEAATLREARKQQAREKAMKAPIKILIPLILFIFPTIFIVILGPVVVTVSELFK